MPKANIPRNAAKRQPAPFPQLRPPGSEEAAGDSVDEASQESFPASDPPSWSATNSDVADKDKVQQAPPIREEQPKG